MPQRPQHPPYPPPPDISSAIPQDHKQCDVCRMIRHFENFGHNRVRADGKRPTCRDCVNQAKRIKYDNSIGRLRPLKEPQLDLYIRNLKAHNLTFLKAFLSGTEYSIMGPAYNVPEAKDYSYELSRIPNTALVELHLIAPDGDRRLQGISLLHQDIASLLALILDFRLEHTAATMHMAKLYIYSRP